jgi:hypothetical protein
MAQLSEPMFRDETLPEEIVAYKPYSPAAMLGLFAGIAAVLAALAVWDIGWGFLAVPIVGLFFGWKGLGSVRRYDMAGKLAAKGAILLSTLSLIGGTANYIYLLKTTVPADYLRITYEDYLGPGAGGPIPDSAQKLDGKKVYINGYMYPTNQGYGMTRFVLCRDNGTCCFGGQPKLNDMVEVKVKPGLTIDHTSSLRGIGGVFHARAEKDPGGLGQIIYHIDDADVLH